MGLPKGYDVKNPVSRPHPRETHPFEPDIQPHAPWASAEEAEELEAIASAPSEFEELLLEHGLPDESLASTDDLTGSTAPLRPSVSRSVPA